MIFDKKKSPYFSASIAKWTIKIYAYLLLPACFILFNSAAICFTRWGYNTATFVVSRLYGCGCISLQALLFLKQILIRLIS